MIEAVYSFRKFVEYRLKLFFQLPVAQTDGPAGFQFREKCATAFVRLYQSLDEDGQKTLLTALAPHIDPAFYDRIIQQFLPNGGDIIEMGGVKNAGNHRGFLPTGETALFIIAGNDMQKRLEAQKLLAGESRLVREGIVSVERVKDGEPPMSGRLVVSHEWLDKLLLGKEQTPIFGPDFPAKAITTELEWNQLILTPKTAEQLADIRTWLEHNDTLLDAWGMRKLVKPGYRSLFYGPPGTGKTLTAMLLGKEFKRDVFRIDLSQVVSKYIGETEKNLEKIFQRAANKDWFLFFDEADALFGKRTNVKDSHDRYANQEVSYLLQRVEDFPGLVILASNFKSNMDKAFIRRFNSMIQFPMPTADERLVLWNSIVPKKAKLGKGVQLDWFAAKYELSGAAIVQVVHYAALKALSEKRVHLDKEDLLAGIQRELEKEDRVFK